ncbi:unnamed protein product [Rotaria sp. Silwood1]|nr:unnamed protein product [Rotaria sp. Silwood1]CAF0993187.1 unnamed protein product [Rotaria sp. Silwood1]CAF3394857.1 unnamed protein product [Rotaria sp. Silwood1]CAF3418886.1 unnamed protein product [Rotaria sp. Silwood1]CAF4565534.1 unnamed protein product [Rotaria sp. Silwood1]
MANNMPSIHPMPRFVIDHCSSEENEEFIKTTTTATTTLPWKKQAVSRSLSLPNYTETYKDLSGAIHYSSSNCLKNYFIRSYSYPNNYFSNEKSFYSPSISTKINVAMGFLDPNNGTCSPAASSSRYSLYGSFFDLSECGYHGSYVNPDNRLLTSDGYSLLTVDNSSKLPTHTYQDKCNDWLSHLDTI